MLFEYEKQSTVRAISPQTRMITRFFRVCLYLSQTVNLQRVDPDGQDMGVYTDILGSFRHCVVQHLYSHPHQGQENKSYAA